MTHNCQAATPHGLCKFKAQDGSDYCGIHRNYYKRLNEQISRALIVTSRIDGEEYKYLVVPKGVKLTPEGWAIEVYDVETHGTLNLKVKYIVSMTEAPANIVTNHLVKGV